MQSTRPLIKLTPVDPQIFTDFYRAAKENDRDTLNKLLIQGHAIGIRLGYHSPVSLLASEGNLHAVKLLINEFLACASEAAYGFSMSGYHQHAWLMLGYGASELSILRGKMHSHTDATAELTKWIELSDTLEDLEHLGNNEENQHLHDDTQILLQQLFKETCLVGYPDLVDSVMRKCGRSRGNNYDPNFFYSVALSGLILGGHEDLIKQYFFHPTSDSIFLELGSLNNLLQTAAKAYGIMGNTTALNNLYARYIVPGIPAEATDLPVVNSNEEKFLTAAIKGLALAARTFELASLLNEKRVRLTDSTQTQLSEALRSAIYGLAAGGHTVQLNKLLKQANSFVKIGPSNLTVLNGYAFGGHTLLMFNLLCDKKHGEIAALHQSYLAKNNKQVILICNMWKGWKMVAPYRPEHESNNLVWRGPIIDQRRMLAFVNCSESRTNLAKFLAPRFNVDDQQLNAWLLTQKEAGRLNNLMQRYHVHYWQAQALLATDTWILIAVTTSLSMQGELSHDALILIAAMTLQLPKSEVYGIVNAVLHGLYLISKRLLTEKFPTAEAKASQDYLELKTAIEEKRTARANSSMGLFIPVKENDPVTTPYKSPSHN